MNKKIIPKILLVGESGSGKNTIQDYLSSLYGYVPLLSYTTRPRRIPEENTHTFITEDEYYHYKIEDNKHIIQIDNRQGRYIF